MSLHLMRSPEAAKADGTTDEYIRLIRQNGYKANEWEAVETFIRKIQR
jgi:hypothetical protein